MSKRLEGRVAVITGAGSGIGHATSIRLASEGAHIVAVDTNEETGNEIAKEIGGIFVKADVTNAEHVEKMYKVAFDTYGRIDIAFNNAGISPPDDDSILITGIDAWERVLRVNTTSVYLCCKAVIPYMQKAGKGSIINTASFVATMGAATSQIAYTASKGGVLSMSRELGVQFAREGIRVNALSPGPVNTPLLMELFAKDPDRAARRLIHIPLGRFAEASEIVGAEDAAELVELEWDVLDVALSQEDSLTSTAVLHEDMGDNLAFDFTMTGGDPDDAFAKADIIIEEEIRPGVLWKRNPNLEDVFLKLTGKSLSAGEAP